jgi:HD-GYP domain-containing protein (c-di-GMP phosphodiesterase class II)
MTSDRVYREKISKQDAIEELKRNKGTQFDPFLVDLFIDALEEEDER